MQSHAESVEFRMLKYLIAVHKYGPEFVTQASKRLLRCLGTIVLVLAYVTWLCAVVAR